MFSIIGGLQLQIIGGRQPGIFLEGSGKIINIEVAEGLSDCGDTAVVAQKHFLGFFDPQVVNIGNGRHAVQLGEELAKINGTQGGEGRQLVIGDILSIMLGDVVYCRLNLALFAGRAVSRFFCAHQLQDNIIDRADAFHFAKRTAQGSEMLQFFEALEHLLTLLAGEDEDLVAFFFTFKINDRAIAGSSAGPLIRAALGKDDDMILVGNIPFVVDIVSGFAAVLHDKRPAGT